MSDQEDPPIPDTENLSEPTAHAAEASKEITPLQEMLDYIDAQSDPDAKLAMAIGFMEKALAQTGSPQFRNFWELRKLCQKLFREDLAPGVRAMLWSRFNELSEEGRRLKEILDEQSAFAVEQIEIAVKSLEDDLNQFAQLLERTPMRPLPVYSQALEAHITTFQAIQHELNLLNACASRINALRKELMKTDMRIGQKNRFFQRLSAAGDRVFPRRKELIKSISDRFTADVDAFIAIAFGNRPPEAIRGIREEIKSLQAMAKTLTLNTQSFNSTRKRLSECWDKLKEVEKEQRHERAKEKAQVREKAQEITTQIDQFKDQFQKGEVSLDVAKKQIDDLNAGVRSLEVLRDEMNALKESMRQARQLVVERAKAAEQARYEQEQERKNQRRAKLDALSDRIGRLLAAESELSSEQMVAEREAIIRELDVERLSRDEKARFDRELKNSREVIIERREKELLSLSADDQQALLQLRQVLSEREARRQESREQLELLRKASGQSGRDFEQALLFSAQQAEERARLERLEEGIQEIEDKIAELEDKV
jgi:hypothetical protein